MLTQGDGLDTAREDRLCHSSKDMEDEQHFFFSCSFSAGLLCFRLFLLTLNQMHVVVSSDSGFHVGNLLYSPDISTCVVFCLLAPCWSEEHKNIKVNFPTKSNHTNCLSRPFNAPTVRWSARKVGRMKGCRCKLQGISKLSPSAQTAYTTRCQVRYHGKCKK